MSILKCIDLQIKYKDKVILENINLEIEKGKIYSIIGPNGSGKSTLIKAMTGFLKPSKGTVLLNNNNISKMKNKEIARNIAVLNQNNNEFIDLTVQELVSYGRYAHKPFLGKNTSEDEKIINWAIKINSLEQLVNRRISNLSGGERQRAWIAMSICQKPEILILDEPTTFLDISYQLEILELIKNLNSKEDLTIVMVLHDINQAIKYSDAVIVLKNKNIITKSINQNNINKTILDEVFNVESKIIKSDDIDENLYYPIKKRKEVINNE
ncbi:ABC transporter ATP-binding protein [uncultured Ezakiella sp.]|uniref:ABC transporter ATP-binding protein n=1 Tax=uncultured Ezakiella sp. TaxID=1637529 RepID=UPI0025D3EB5B|nr:ABC transporter ATP-binding protein [uncultured Ezakiella sp.]